MKVLSKTRNRRISAPAVTAARTFTVSPALVVISILIIAAMLTLAGCTYYVIPDEEDTPVSTVDSRVAYDITVTLTGPVKSGAYYPGDALIISWESGAAVSAVNLDLYRGEDFAASLAAGFSKGSSFTWIIPEGLAADETYRIKVIDVSDAKSQDLFGFSGYFAVSSKPDSGLSDVTVSQAAITLTLIDNGSLVDGDTVTVSLNGLVIADRHVLTGPPGTELSLTLLSGSNTLEIYAVNEGEVSPNTAQLTISHVTAGEAVQQWRLYTGESGSLVISAP